MESADHHRRLLIRQLQGAYSGELAAAFAYHGHWRSLSASPARERIREIENDEWHHRELVHGLLVELGAAPSRRREAMFWLIGKTLGLLCHVSPWFFAMYGAGRLESGNIVEYQEAAVFAERCGQGQMIDSLLTMAEVEWDHELFFRQQIEGHALLRLFPMWSVPPRRETIRALAAG
jgi:hypothetical protein